MVNIQGAWQEPPPLCSLGGKEEAGGCSWPLPQVHLPLKAMILPFQRVLRGQPSWPQKTVAGKKAAISKKATSPLPKTTLL